MNITPQKLFLFVAIIWGTVTVFITPPFQVPDEAMHFFRCYNLSCGKFSNETRNNLVGAPLPVSVSKIGYLFSDIPFHPEKKVNLKKFSDSFLLPLNPRDTVYTLLTNSAQYFPIPYMPQVFAMTIPRLFHIHPVYLIYAGRLGNLFIWTLLIYCAICLTPVGKWLFVIISLLPMTVFQVASLSPDALTINLAFLLISLIFRLAFDEHGSVKKNDMLIVAVLAVLVALSKNAYAPLCLLVFLIPRGKFSSGTTFLLFRTGILVVSGLAIVAGSIYVKYVYRDLDMEIGLYGALPAYPQHVNPYRQVEFIKSGIFGYFHTITKTLWIQRKDILTSFIGRLGWLDVGLPVGYNILACAMLGLAAVSYGKPEILFTIQNRMIVMGAFGCTVFLLCTLLYLGWTPVGQADIQGLQGRYFIPVAPLILILFRVRLFRIPDKLFSLVAGLFILVTFFVMNYALIHRYYIN